MSSRIFENVTAKWTFCVQQFFFRPKTISKVAIMKIKGAAIAFFSSPPFFLLALSFSLFLLFVSVIFELIGPNSPKKKPLFAKGPFGDTVLKIRLQLCTY